MNSSAPSPAPSRPRLLWVDLIRTVSAFGVIFTHVTMEVVNFWGKRPIQTGDEAWWTTGVFYAYLARSALGLFFMLSGYLLLSKQDDTSAFLKKSLWKLLVPLAFWGTFYILWHGNLPEHPVKLVKHILLSLATGKVEFHLWFLYAFVGLYLFVPILRIFLRTAQDRDVWYYVAVWFLLVPVASLIFHLTSDAIALMNYAFFSGFIGYFLLGYLLGRLKPDPKWILLAGLLIPLWAAAETWFQYSQTRAAKSMQDQWFDTLTVLVIPYTVLCFVALKGWGERIQRSLKESSRVSSIWEAMSRASLGIILVHVVVLEVMYTGFGGIHLAPTDFHPALSVPIISVVGYAICFGLVYLAQKIPFIRALVPA